MSDRPKTLSEAAEAYVRRQRGIETPRKVITSNPTKKVITAKPETEDVPSTSPEVVINPDGTRQPVPETETSKVEVEKKPGQTIIRTRQEDVPKSTKVEVIDSPKPNLIVPEKKVITELPILMNEKLPKLDKSLTTDYLQAINDPNNLEKIIQTRMNYPKKFNIDEFKELMLKHPDMYKHIMASGNIDFPVEIAFGDLLKQKFNLKKDQDIQDVFNILTKENPNTNAMIKLNKVLREATPLHTLPDLSLITDEKRLMPGTVGTYYPSDNLIVLPDYASIKSKDMKQFNDSLKITSHEIGHHDNRVLKAFNDITKIKGLEFQQQVLHALPPDERAVVMSLLKDTYYHPTTSTIKESNKTKNSIIKDFNKIHGYNVSTRSKNDPIRQQLGDKARSFSSIDHHLRTTQPYDTGYFELRNIPRMIKGEYPRMLVPGIGTTLLGGAAAISSDDASAMIPFLGDAETIYEHSDKPDPNVIPGESIIGSISDPKQQEEIRRFVKIKELMNQDNFPEAERRKQQEKQEELERQKEAERILRMTSGF